MSNEYGKNDFVSYAILYGAALLFLSMIAMGVWWTVSCFLLERGFLSRLIPVVTALCVWLIGVYFILAPTIKSETRENEIFLDGWEDDSDEFDNDLSPESEGEDYTYDEDEYKYWDK